MEDLIKQKVEKYLQEGKAKLSDKFIDYSYEETPFSVRMYDVIFNGGWNYSCYEFSTGKSKVKKNIGKLYRNYPKSNKICQPYLFESNWYILFSEDYNHLSLYDENLNKINQTKSGFCPIEVYVPRFKKTDMYCNLVADNQENFNDFKEESFYSNFGFISGCHWGDDFSAKIRTLDLSDPEFFCENEEYGYVQIPYSLRKSVKFWFRGTPNTKNVRILDVKCIDNFKIMD